MIDGNSGCWSHNSCIRCSWLGESPRLHRKGRDALFLSALVIDTAAGVKAIQIDDWRRHGESLVAHIVGIDDRNIAQTWCGNDILVEKDKLPELKSDDYYWYQLEGLSVISHYEGEQIRLGTVKSLLETGANDVLVVKGDGESIDREERLIPYVDQFVTSISMADKTIDVIWDPAF